MENDREIPESSCDPEEKDELAMVPLEEQKSQFQRGRITSSQRRYIINITEGPFN